MESRIDALQTVRCALDLGEVTFGGVKEACRGAMPDKKRCCPVLAAWVYAADARLALFPPTKSGQNNSAGDTDVDITLNCISSLQSALQVKEAFFDTGNSSCDPVVCYCGIYLTELDDESCPFSDFRNGGESRSSSILRSTLEQNCRIASYKGCTNCVETLQNSQPASQFTTNPSLNATREEYCKLMGLMWLLYNNRTAYIPTVSSVIRALLYSNNDTHATPECSPNSENMPLATNGIEYVNVESSANHYDIRTVIQLTAAPLTLIVLLLTGQYV
ncbi:hypothetical protein R1sor_012868 [Riccia sorocarpa]|uniref:SPARK domain-containing protein n=1 Tax=Riccia sorocarpa TaxID=122646 RepID=A0ABD3I4Y1_9MARC